jgi:hypothetical protein
MLVTLDLAACPVIEMRRYTLHPGTAPILLGVFERRLVEAQEQVGMTVAGTFLDEDDADAFVWMRGFGGHEQRTAALTAFYGGPVWARNADTANATMIDSGDVLLLRPTDPARAPRRAVERGDADDVPRSDRVITEVLTLPNGADGDHVETWVARDGIAAVEQALGVPVAAWRTDPTPNGFPRLPVREDRVVVWLASFTDFAARELALDRLTGDPVDRELVARTMSRRRFLLSPTARSAHPAPGVPMRRGAEARHSPAVTVAANQSV